MNTPINRDVETFIWLLQRLSAIILSACTIIHIITIINSVKIGLTSADIINRIGANYGWFIFYLIFVLSASIHAPIGIRSILKESTNASNVTITLITIIFAILLVSLGIWSIWGFYRIESVT